LDIGLRTSDFEDHTRVRLGCPRAVNASPWDGRSQSRPGADPSAGAGVPAGDGCIDVCESVCSSGEARAVARTCQMIQYECAGPCRGSCASEVRRWCGPTHRPAFGRDLPLAWVCLTRLTPSAPHVAARVPRHPRQHRWTERLGVGPAGSGPPRTGQVVGQYSGLTLPGTHARDAAESGAGAGRTMV
jgi:hypothetical protein